MSVTIDNVEMDKNIVQVSAEFKISVTLHEDYENSKKYKNKYAYRYGKKGDKSV